MNNKRLGIVVKKISIIFFAVLFILLSLPLVTQAASTSDNKVAELTIYSDGSGKSYGTHSFISIKNISSTSFTVLGVTVDPNQMITIGTWGNKNDGKGIYINLEAYFINEYDAYKERVSLTKQITQNELNTVIAKIKKNNEWSYLDNCAFFAVDVWNSVATKSEKLSAGLIPTPATLSKNIKKVSGYKTAKAVGEVAKDHVYRYNGNTTNSVSSSSLSSQSSQSSQ